MQTAIQPFGTRICERSLELDTRLCLGIDLHPELILNPEDKTRLDPNTFERIVGTYVFEILEACAPFICAVKPQLAHFEALGWRGIRLLERMCAEANLLQLPIILDGKRGDISSTAEAYARAWLEGDHAGSAITAHAYLGFDTLSPLVQAARANAGMVFVLVRTSNPGADALQLLSSKTEQGQQTVAETVGQELTRLAADDISTHGYAHIGAVIAATRPGELARWRLELPGVLLLLPGLGAQGGKAETLATAFDKHGLGAIATASRALCPPLYSKNIAQHSRDIARGLRDELRQALRKQLGN